MAWTANDIPDQTGRISIVTGGNSGLGYWTALELARKGGEVALACRNPAKAKEAVESIRREHGNGSVEAMALDLASLTSVQDFAERFRERYSQLHLLCNNAGVMAMPKCHTVDGFEMQLGTNHLGHFALTGRLLGLLVATPGSRVVNVSSTAHKLGKIDFDDLQSETGYSRWGAYGQSKLANLLFTRELQRRFDEAGVDSIAASSHPGWASTNLQTAAPKLEGSSIMVTLADLGNRLFAQSAAMGALPSLYAAVAPDVEGGDYIGPGGLLETRGHPVKVKGSARSRDGEVAARLWQVSEGLTGVRFEGLAH